MKYDDTKINGYKQNKQKLMVINRTKCVGVYWNNVSVPN
jgi:hypothetical protein